MMTRLTGLRRQLRFVNERQLRRALIVLSVAAVLAALVFAVVYYRDRYVAPANPGTMSDAQKQIEHLREQIRLDPKNVELRVAVAQYFFTAGRLQETVAQSSEALKLDSDHQGAHYLRALAYAQLGKTDEATADLEHIVALNRDNPMAEVDQRLESVYYELGTLYANSGKPAQAVTALRSALAINKTDADAWNALGQALHQLGQDKDAVEAYQQAVRFVPDFAEAFAGLEKSYRALGQQSQADYAAGMVAFGERDYHRAVELLEPLAENHSDVIETYLGLGLAYERTGARDKALSALERYIAARPDDLAAQQAFARIQKSQ